MIENFNNLKEILSLNYELKKLDEFFDTYESAYPFEKGKALNCLKQIGNFGKIQFHEIFLFWFPEIYSLYKNTFNIIFNSTNRCIPITWKYYIGIMASATIKCEFLFKHLEAEFLLNDGDENWLIYGLEAVPEKLRKLEKINNILAHQPWKLKESDILEIYLQSNLNFWNLNELVEGILIMVNIHRLAGIIESIKLGLGGAKNLSDDFEIFSIEEKFHDSKLLKFLNNEEIIKFKIFNELKNLNVNKNLNDKIYNVDEINSEKREFKPENVRLNNNDEKLLNTLHCIDSSKNLPIKRKFSEDNNSSKLNSSFENIFSIEDFSKHISNFCTVYLDFDSHSDKYKSYFVNKLIIKLN